MRAVILALAAGLLRSDPNATLAAVSVRSGPATEALSAHVLQDVTRRNANVQADFSGWCSEAIAYFNNEVQTFSALKEEAAARLATASQKQQAVAAQKAADARAAMPQSTSRDAGMEAALKAMEHSFSSENEALGKASVEANLEHASAKQDYDDADTFVRTIGDALGQTNRACRTGEEIAQEVNMALAARARAAEPAEVGALAQPPVAALVRSQTNKTKVKDALREVYTRADLTAKRSARAGLKANSSLRLKVKALDRTVARKGDPPPTKQEGLDVMCDGTAPFCNGGCPHGWTQAHRTDGGRNCYESACTDCGKGCWTGSKAFCYRRTSNPMNAAQLAAEAAAKEAREAAAMEQAEKEEAKRRAEQEKAAQEQADKAHEASEKAKAAAEKTQKEEEAAEKAEKEALEQQEKALEAKRQEEAEKFEKEAAAAEAAEKKAHEENEKALAAAEKAEKEEAAAEAAEKAYKEKEEKMIAAAEKHEKEITEAKEKAEQASRKAAMDTTVGGLGERKQHLERQLAECQQLATAAGQLAAHEAIATKATQDALSEQQKRADFARARLSQYQALQAKVGELGSKAKTLFGEEQQLYASEVTQATGSDVQALDNMHMEYVDMKEHLGVCFDRVLTYTGTRIKQLESAMANFEYNRPDQLPHMQYPKTAPPEGCPDPADLQKALQDVEAAISQTQSALATPPPTPPSLPILSTLGRCLVSHSWRSHEEAAAMSDDDQRNTVITEMTNKYGIGVPELQAMGTSDLADLCNGCLDVGGTWKDGSGVVTVMVTDPEKMGIASCTGAHEGGAWTYTVAGATVTLSDGTTGAVTGSKARKRTITWSNGITYKEQ